MSIKFRAATKHFMGKTENGGIMLDLRYCIECLHNRRWRLFGDETGVYKFKNTRDRDAKIAELNEEVANSEKEQKAG